MGKDREVQPLTIDNQPFTHTVDSAFVDDEGDVALECGGIHHWLSPHGARQLHAWLGKVILRYAERNDGETGTKAPEPYFSDEVTAALRDGNVAGLADAYAYIETEGPVGSTWIADVMLDAYHQGAVDQAFSA